MQQQRQTLGPTRRPQQALRYDKALELKLTDAVKRGLEAQGLRVKETRISKKWKVDGEITVEWDGIL